TPDEQPGASPVYASDFHSPRGLDWQPSSGRLWIADHDGRGSQIAAVSGGRDGSLRVADRPAYSLAKLTVASGAAFYRGRLIPAFRNTLFIASAEQQHLLRVRFDAADPTQVAGVERLLQDRVGAIRAVAISPAGEVYF